MFTTFFLTAIPTGNDNFIPRDKNNKSKGIMAVFISLRSTYFIHSLLLLFPGLQRRGICITVNRHADRQTDKIFHLETHVWPDSFRFSLTVFLVVVVM